MKPKIKVTSKETGACRRGKEVCIAEHRRWEDCLAEQVVEVYENPTAFSDDMPDQLQSALAILREDASDYSDPNRSYAHAAIEVGRRAKDIAALAIHYYPSIRRGDEPPTMPLDSLLEIVKMQRGQSDETALQAVADCYQAGIAVPDYAENRVYAA